MTEEPATVAGHFPCRPQPASDWTGPIPLSEALAGFYAGGGPLDAQVEADWTTVCVSSLAGLWGFQACYRYDPETLAPLEGWDDDLIVVATVRDSPYVVSRTTGRVSFSEIDGDGWAFEEAFDSLDELLPGLSEDIAEAEERRREAALAETARRTVYPTVAEISVACKGVPVPIVLKAAWLEHGYGNRPGRAEVRRVLSPEQVRDLHAGAPDLFAEATPFFEDGLGRYATVDAKGKVRLPDGAKGGTIGTFLERLAVA